MCVNVCSDRLVLEIYGKWKFDVVLELNVNLFDGFSMSYDFTLGNCHLKWC